MYWAIFSCVRIANTPEKYKMPRNIIQMKLYTDFRNVMSNWMINFFVSPLSRAWSLSLFLATRDCVLRFKSFPYIHYMFRKDTRNYDNVSRWNYYSKVRKFLKKSHEYIFFKTETFFHLRSVISTPRLVKVSQLITLNFISTTTKPNLPTEKRNCFLSREMEN